MGEAVGEAERCDSAEHQRGAIACEREMQKRVDVRETALLKMAT